jgi:hypothetical protein
MSAPLAIGAVAALAALGAVRGRRRGQRNVFGRDRDIPSAGEVDDVLLARTIKSQDFARWMRDEWEASPDEWDPEDLPSQAEEYLSAEHGVTLKQGEDYPQVWRISPVLAELLDGLPFELYHATSSAVLEDGIVPQGMLRGARAEHQVTDQTYSSRAGLYLSSDYNHALGHYGTMAEDKWGGEAVILTVLVFLDELEPDPDDVALGSGKNQWVTPALPISRVVNVYPSWYRKLVGLRP